jgi:purine-binding chemotaxis protein CheW
MTKAFEETCLFCTFRVGRRWFGVPVRDVKEVTTQTTCTPIPHAPPAVAGYINIRGHIFMAVDSHAVLGLDDGDRGGERLILFHQSVGASFGLLVDEIGDIVTVSPEQIEPLRAGSHDAASSELTDPALLVTRVCRLDDGLLAILEPRRFPQLIEQSIHVV